MNIQEMHKYFDVLQDKYNAPYFTSKEKDLFLNQAQDIYISDVVGYKGTGSTLEITEQNQYIVEPLIEARVYNTNGFPIVLPSIPSLGRTFLHIMSVNVNSNNTGTYKAGKNIEFVRHNDINRFNENTFKKPNVDKKLYWCYQNGFLQILPSSDANESIDITMLLAPIRMEYNSDINLCVNCELPAIPCHDIIVKKALELANITTKDLEQTNLIKLSNAEGSNNNLYR